MRLRVLTVAAVTAAVTLSVAPGAGAHVQVIPARAAVDDGVLFTMLVPNERETANTEVELKFPAGTLPYGFEDPPGWKRQTILAPNKSVDRVRWTGSLKPKDFARFTFLAGTPPKAGALDWKAIQTYEDGVKVRWIGAPESESPASRTILAGDVPRQDAGVVARADTKAGGAAPAAETAAKPVAATAAVAGSDGPDWIARGLAAAALLAALGGVMVARHRA